MDDPNAVFCGDKCTQEICCEIRNCLTSTVGGYRGKEYYDNDFDNGSPGDIYPHNCLLLLL